MGKSIGGGSDKYSTFSINSDAAKSSSMVSLPTHKVYPTSREYAIKVWSGSITGWPLITIANKTYMFPLSLVTNLDLLHVLDELAAGVGGVEVYHDPKRQAELSLFDAELSQGIAGKNVFMKRKFANDGYRAALMNVANLINAGVNAFDYGVSQKAPDATVTDSQLRAIHKASELAAVIELVSSLATNGNAAPVTQAVICLFTQMYSFEVTHTGDTITVDVQPGTPVPVAVVDPRVWLVFAEYAVYHYDADYSGATRLFEGDGVSHLVVTYGQDHTVVASADKTDAMVSIADLYHTDDLQQASIVTPNNGTLHFDADTCTFVQSEDADPWLDKAWYPFEIDTTPENHGYTYTQSGSFFTRTKETIRVASNGEVVLPDPSSFVDTFPKLASNHVAMEAMVFCGEAVKKVADLQYPTVFDSSHIASWDEGLQYGKYSIKSQAEASADQGAYILSPYSKATGLEAIFKSSDYRKSLRSSIGNFLYGQAAITQDSLIMGSRYGAIAFATFALANGNQIELRIDPTQAFYVFANVPNADADLQLPVGFVPVDIGGIPETRVTPVYSYGPLRMQVAYVKVTGPVGERVREDLTSGTFVVDHWPDLAFSDVYDYLEATRLIVELASKDNAAGPKQREPGSKIPKNWFSELLDWLTSLLDSKWLWIIIALIVLILVLRGRSSGGGSTVVIQQSPAPIQRATANVARAQNSQSRASSASAQSGPDLSSDFT